MSSELLNKKFAQAESLMEQMRYRDSFSIFQEISINSSNSHLDRSDAYNMMGIIVECCDPGLASGDDESGLEYYKKALFLTPMHLGALEGVIRSFGESFPDHQDILAFKSAYSQLINRKSELDPDFLKKLEEKYALMKKMEAKNNSFS